MNSLGNQLQLVIPNYQFPESSSSSVINLDTFNQYINEDPRSSNSEFLVHLYSAIYKFLGDGIIGWDES